MHDEIIPHIKRLNGPIKQGVRGVVQCPIVNYIWRNKSFIKCIDKEINFAK